MITDIHKVVASVIDDGYSVLGKRGNYYCEVCGRNYKTSYSINVKVVSSPGLLIYVVFCLECFKLFEQMFLDEKTKKVKDAMDELIKRIKQ